MIKVLIVDDSITFREWLKALFSQGTDFSVVGMASNGADAIKCITSLNPDVVVLDYVLPEMTGIDVTQQIMTVKPVPIVILSAEQNLAGGAGFNKSVDAGALFFFEKPGKETPKKRWEENFLRTCRAASRVPVLRRLKSTGKQIAPPAIVAQKISLIGIGASTGGPQTVASILKALPAVRATVVLVLHSSEGLSEQLLEWYSTIAPMPIEILRGPRSIDESAGIIFIAPAGKHVELKDRTLFVTDGEPRNFCKPSVDVFFESMATLKSAGLGVLLTGMGRDGAKGLKAIRDQGGATLAQDEESSIIYGMPKAAADIGAAQQILPATKIAQAISSYFSKETA